MLSENMASLGGEQIISTKDLQDSTPQKTTNSRPSSVERKLASRDRDEKLRLIKERQNEERQRKIEELKAQAEAAQKYREQKEEERKRRIEELRNRENDKRHQVEERKKALMEAEKEKREFILRRNQERESKLENKRRNERSSVYAFGSSTPRLLDPAELGTLSQSTYWGHRRSTSITNVAYTGAPLSRRSSERELADGSKKRATSAGGIDRQTDEDITDSPPISYRSVARRKTDLMPTIPSPRESSFGSKTSLHSHTPRTPGRAVSMTRLDQLAQPIRRNGEHIRAVIERERQQQYGILSNTSPNTLTLTSPTSANAPKCMSRSMTHLAGTKQVYSYKHINDNNSINGDQHVRMRPMKKNDTSRSMTQLTTANRIITTTTATKKITAARSARYERKDDAPSSLASTGSRSGDVTPGGSINTSRPGSAMSTSTTASGLVQRRSVGTVRKPRPASIAVTGVSLIDDFNKHKKEKPPLPKQQSTPKRLTSNSNTMSKSMSVDTPKTLEKRSSAKKDVPTPKPRAILQQTTDNNDKLITESVTVTQTTVETITTEKEIIADIPQTKEEKEALNAVKTEAGNASENIEIKKEVVTETKAEIEEPIEITPTEEKVDTDTEKEKEKEPSPKPASEIRELSAERQDNEMTASMIARKITTEEQAKAVLAEKRRLMREEAERQAELERQRLEAERLVELKRQAEEEERQRKFEEETLRLVEEQKKAEEQRLLQAIEEAKKREEAERLKREEEEKQRLEREEAERKAKEEAEKQRLEIAERLKKEEKEREERRKRVEAIMSRTRAKGGNATPNSTPTKENDTNKVNGKDEKVEENVEKSTNEQSTLNNESDQTAQSDSTAITQQQQQPQEPAAESTLAQVESQQQQVQPQQPAQQIDEPAQQPQEQPQPTQLLQETQQQQLQTVEQQQTTQPQSFSEQVAYEKTVTDRENALINSFSNMIIDDVKVFPNFQNPFVPPPPMTNGKTLQEQNQSNESVVQSISNGNGHIENINKNDTNQLVDFSTDQLIEFNNESQQVTGSVNFNNNSLSSTMGPNLVTSDSHENKEISLL